MSNILKKISVLVFVLVVAHGVMAQGFEPKSGFRQINFGVGVSSWGVPVYVGADFWVHEKITIGPRLSYRSYSERYAGYDFDYSIFNIGFRGDYHYGPHITDLPSELDLYGGLTLGYSSWHGDFNDLTGYNAEDSRVYLALQAGARWYFNQQWAANAELSGGSFTGLEIGVSYQF